MMTTQATFQVRCAYQTPSGNIGGCVYWSIPAADESEAMEIAAARVHKRKGYGRALDMSCSRNVASQRL